jgi:hypothetical protein
MHEDGMKPLRVDNELSNINPLGDVDKENEAALTSDFLRFYLTIIRKAAWFWDRPPKPEASLSGKAQKKRHTGGIEPLS